MILEVGIFIELEPVIVELNLELNGLVSFEGCQLPNQAISMIM